MVFVLFEQDKMHSALTQAVSKTTKPWIREDSPPNQYFVEPPSAASLLGYVSNSFAHLDAEICAHFSLQHNKLSEIGWSPSENSKSKRFSVGFTSGFEWSILMH